LPAIAAAGPDGPTQQPPAAVKTKEEKYRQMDDKKIKTKTKKKMNGWHPLI
jgi:hypothetical protein